MVVLSFTATALAGDNFMPASDPRGLESLSGTGSQGNPSWPTHQLHGNLLRGQAGKFERCRALDHFTRWPVCVNRVVFFASTPHPVIPQDSP